MKRVLVYVLFAALLSAQQSSAPPKKAEQPIEVQRLSEFREIKEPTEDPF
jgi:hypothetical protein